MSRTTAHNSDVSLVSSTGSSDSLSSLNSQLLSHGWAKRPLNLDALPERDLGDVISVFFELLGSSISNIDNLDALTSRHRTLQYELERTQKALTTSRTAQRRAELEAAGWRSRVQGLERKAGEEESKVRELREESARGRRALEGVRVAAGHDAKKMQTKLDQANAKLTKLATDSSLMAGSEGMFVLNPISSTRSQPVVTGQAPLLEQSLLDLAQIRQSLEEETEAFRHVVVSTGNLLREAIAASSGCEAPQRLQQSYFFSQSQSVRASPSSQQAPSITHPQIASERLQSLISTLRSKLEAKIIRIPAGEGVLPPDPEEVEALARQEREQAKERQDLVERMKDLEIEVECVKGREEEAKRSLDEYVKRQMQDTMDKAAERDHDTSDLLNVLREREKLEDERRHMMEAMGRLSKEKRLFERERLAFVEERRRVDVDDVLAQLPNTPAGATSWTQPPHPLPSGGTVEIARDQSSDPALALVTQAPHAGPRWTAHQPHSPSPLSPHKPRTPKAHLAKTKRAKTPLSRLVLEKAVRRKSLGLTVEQVQIQAQMAPAPTAASDREVLGEGSKRTNITASINAPATSGVHVKVKLASSSKGKERAKDDRSLSASTARRVEGGKLGVSTASARITTVGRPVPSLGSSQRSMGTDMGASSGAAARSNKAKAVWR